MYAVSYASPYKGSAHGGYVAQPVYHSVGSVGVAQRPTATMGSTSAYRGTINSGVVAVQQVRGISTSASAIRGGVTADVTYGRIGGGPRKTSGSDIGPDPEGCGCHDGNGDGKCDECGHDMPEDEFDDCGCNPCWCPIGDGWDVWLFMAVLGTGYAFVARRREELKAKS